MYLGIWQNACSYIESHETQFKEKDWTGIPRNYQESYRTRFSPNNGHRLHKIVLSVRNKAESREISSQALISKKPVLKQEDIAEFPERVLQLWIALNAIYNLQFSQRRLELQTTCPKHRSRSEITLKAPAIRSWAQNRVKYILKLNVSHNVLNCVFRLRIVWNASESF